MISKPSVLSFPAAPRGEFAVRVTPLVHNYIAVGTGYGVGDEFRHGMYMADLVVEGKTWDMAELDTWAWYGGVDHAARFVIEGGDADGVVGYGLHEHGVFGEFAKFGLADGAATA
jgi:hypothetical protein